MSFYPLLKTIHISTVIFSFVFFLTRAYWLLRKPGLLQNKAVKILPHINDSILLFSALALVYTGKLLPLSDNPWIIAKVSALVCYIINGVYLFRIASTHFQRYIALTIAILIYLYLLQTAVSKSIIPVIH
ncbi:MAG: SirB2 family protein [Gammaproteobacteria bacterium]|nr:SirB2 family protein [Gammaproteobacteria bacterium]